MTKCHHQSDPTTCPTCQVRKTKEGKPLLLAIHDAVDQFSENHQALRGLMFNTLCVIVEMGVGPLLAKAREFKEYVHKRLDAAGVPRFDDGRDCRIGARLDWMLGSAAVRDVLAEREKQRSARGYDAAHDDEHDDGLILTNAIECAENASHVRGIVHRHGSWKIGEKHYHDKRKLLVIATALMVAEIERRDRVAAICRNIPLVGGGETTLPVEGKREVMEPAAAKSKEYHCHECGVEFGLRHEDGCNQAKLSPGRCVDCEAGAGMPHRDGCKLAGVVL